MVAKQEYQQKLRSYLTQLYAGNLNGQQVVRRNLLALWTQNEDTVVTCPQSRINPTEPRIMKIIPFPPKFKKHELFCSRHLCPISLAFILEKSSFISFFTWIDFFPRLNIPSWGINFLLKILSNYCEATSIRRSCFQSCRLPFKRSQLHRSSAPRNRGRERTLKLVPTLRFVLMISLAFSRETSSVPSLPRWSLVLPELTYSPSQYQSANPPGQS